MFYQQQDHYAVQEGDQYCLLSGSPLTIFKPTDVIVPCKKVKLLPPVRPTKIIAIGLNYKSHALEMNMDLPEEPLIFLKPLSALAASHDTISLPASSRQVDYEGELTVVIKKQCKDISIDEVDDVIAGYTLANDITARDLQIKDGQWARAKGFDGFCPIGPCIVTDLNWRHLSFETYLNNDLKQTGHVDDFVFDIPTIVSFVSTVMTLYPGDVILTGTPPGIGPMKSGDEIKIICNNIGSLVNSVI